jgi:hypothetical protein
MNILMYTKWFYDNVQLSFQAVAVFYAEAVYNISVYILDTIYWVNVRRKWTRV